MYKGNRFLAKKSEPRMNDGVQGGTSVLRQIWRPLQAFSNVAE